MRARISDFFDAINFAAYQASKIRKLRKALGKSDRLYDEALDTIGDLRRELADARQEILFAEIVRNV